MIQIGKIYKEIKMDMQEFKQFVISNLRRKPTTILFGQLNNKIQ